MKQVFEDPIVQAQVEQAEQREAFAKAERAATIYHKAQPKPTITEWVEQRAEKDADLLIQGRSSWNVFQSTRNRFRDLGLVGCKYWPTYCKKVAEKVAEKQPTRRLAFPDL